MITVFGPGTNIKELRGIVPVMPEGAGRRWKAIPHGELVDTIQDEIATRGWKIEEELYTTSPDEADMAGALLLGNVRAATPVDVPEGMRLALGFLNSNARRKALQLTVGASVTCCTNGMCTGSLLLSRVHDHTVNLVDAVELAVDKYVGEARGVAKEVAQLRQHTITAGQASEILLEAGRRRLIGWATVGRVDKEYRHPTYAEHGTGTAWALLNAFTFAARPNIAATKQMEVYNAFRVMVRGSRQ